MYIYICIQIHTHCFARPLTPPYYFTRPPDCTRPLPAVHGVIDIYNGKHLSHTFFCEVHSYYTCICRHVSV